MQWDLIVIGGGAAGIFAAIAAKEVNPYARVLVLEKSGSLLAKVRISGGGRCNVTNACFDPKFLVQNYPRGSKELLGPFHRFGPQETVEWFTKRGVALKTEEDLRIFPVSDTSSSIIKALLEEAARLGVVIETKKGVQEVEAVQKGFTLILQGGERVESHFLLLATGSSREGHHFAEQLGHTIQTLAPSLFTFNVPTSPLKELSGISLPKVRITLEDSSLEATGPLLITHFGFSGPAVLRLSAFGARLFAAREYKTGIVLHWLPSHQEGEIFQLLQQAKKETPKKLLASMNLFSLPKNLWKALVFPYGDKQLSSLSQKEMHEIAHKLFGDKYQVEGKTTHKEEFVTAGGVTLKEIDCKTMQSKKRPGLFFAGEILDIDGITGGFNFQNAWTTGFIAGRTVGESVRVPLPSD